MSIDAQLLEDAATELFEDAPCGYLATRLDGTIVKVNRTFERWTGHGRDELLHRRRFQDLLSVGGRIYYETHYAPLLQMQGQVREIAVEVVRADGSRLPALISSVLHRDEDGIPQAIRTTVSDATDRRRYEQELVQARERDRDTALALQRSLLDGDLPASPAAELAVFYAPGGRGIAVGGDWYDAFWLDEEATMGLIVGDVVGRGLGAATTMGQLRSAVRALATTGLGPAELLAALESYSRRFGIGAMTTIAYVELDLVSGAMRYACAGHPPPLIAEPGDLPRFAWDGRSLPINAFTDPAPRGEGTARLAPGATLLLYTDGLVEHRARPVDRGMEELRQLVQRDHAQPLSALIDSVSDGLFDPDLADDRSLLGLRLASRKR